MIPDFTSQGSLPDGVHLTSGNDFLDRFLFNEYRKGFWGPLVNILDWAKLKRASAIFIGGSFVTSANEPHDLDCLIVFPHEDAIPHKSELLTIESTRLDLQFCAQSDEKLLGTFLYLFQHTRGREPVGIIQINLYGGEKPWVSVFSPDDGDYEIIKRVYIQRHYVDHYEPNGVLVSIHGLLSQASWNAEIAPIASSQNWIFAPFLYCDTNSPKLLIDKPRADQVVERFRNWVYDIQCRYQRNISVIAHSFGTYILARYITGFDEFLPIRLNTAILTGSILNPEFDWEAHRGVRIARVLNEVAPNDQLVKHMPKLKWIHPDPLYGNSGVTGFAKECDIVDQMSNDIFDHNNVIKRDVIERHWMPFLMANRDAHTIESNRYILQQHSERSSNKPYNNGINGTHAIKPIHQ